MRGWLLDLYPGRESGTILWVLGEDRERRRLRQEFPVRFYLAGESSRLKSVQDYLAEREEWPAVCMMPRRELYLGERQVLAVETASLPALERLARDIRRRFRRLAHYDIDIPFSVRYLAATGVFPTARVELETEGDVVVAIRALESAWELQFEFPPLRTLHVNLDSDPRLGPPQTLHMVFGDERLECALDSPQGVLEALDGLMETFDPDLLVIPWGDSWLLPRLLTWARESGVALRLSRETDRQPLIKRELRYTSYGDVHHRAGQVHLYGRWHIDPHNTAMFGGFRLAAALEMSRVTGLPVQVAARNSPGAGFTAMQMAEALRRGVLVPLHKRHVEPFRSAQAFQQADSGGLNYRPQVGLHRHVAELDFFSMYPQIMASWNISGETVGKVGRKTRYVPQTGLPITQDEPGLVASVLKPVLAKRRKAKLLMRQISLEDPRWPALEAAADGLKWLGWVSFGYQGFKNNRFGSSLAHEAICAVGREMLTVGKETAFRLGFTVLGANTDSLFVQKPGAARPEDFQELLSEIQRVTRLVLNLEGVFEWLAFLPAKGNCRVGASNRYFGKFQDGKLKVRGLAQRRADTPSWIVMVEQEILEMLAAVPEGQPLRSCLPDVVAVCRRQIEDLYAGRVRLEDLVVAQKLRQEPNEYRGRSPAGDAARQLRAAGREARVGQRIRFLYLRRPSPGVHAWGLPIRPAPGDIDGMRYQRLLALAVHQVLVPLGLEEAAAQSLLGGAVRQLSLWPPAELEGQDGAGLAEALFRQFLTGD